ncbi:conserved hypothetical protein [Gammaproteobacteria bacterium]
MRHKLLADYLMAVERALTLMPGIYVEYYVEEILTSDRANLRIRLRFANGYLLEINEAIIIKGGKLVTLDYRYHCQDSRNRLIFRYDNAPHFPDLPSFPHHKHLANGTIATKKPTVFPVLKESQDVGT